MMDIFNFFGSVLGYLLWFFYGLVHNYGVAIILFTVAVKILLFPFSIKQQKSMAANAKLSLKQKEIQKKYGKDRVKIQEETQKLYEKEGINPASGCLTTLIPFPIMIGLFYTVQNPLANALHLSADAISKAVEMLKQIPGLSAGFNTNYAQIEIVKHFADLKEHLTMFSPDELSRVELFSRGFRFLGLNLLDTPADPAHIFTTLFRSNLWVIPFFCLVTSLLMQFFMTRLQPGMQQQQQGCMKAMFYVLPLFSVWLACTTPAAVGLYWIISNVTGFIQTLAMHVWFSPADLNAKAEAQRIALLELDEAKRKPVFASPAAQPEARQKRPEGNSAQKIGKGKSAKKSSSDYLGSKK